jgi:hypothetical protein
MALSCVALAGPALADPSWYGTFYGNTKNGWFTKTTQNITNPGNSASFDAPWNPGAGNGTFQVGNTVLGTINDNLIVGTSKRGVATGLIVGRDMIGGFKVKDTSGNGRAGKGKRGR